MTGL
jgi:hypothetical protein